MLHHRRPQHQLGARGYNVLLGARNLAKGRQAAKPIDSARAAVPLDITDAGKIAERAAWIERKHGRLDVLVNNAGGHPRLPRLQGRAQRLHPRARRRAHRRWLLINAICRGWLVTSLGGPGGGPVERATASVVAAACQPELGINGALLRDGQHSVGDARPRRQPAV